MLRKDRVIDGERWHGISAVLEAVLLAVHRGGAGVSGGEPKSEEVFRIISARQADPR